MSKEQGRSAQAPIGNLYDLGNLWFDLDMETGSLYWRDPGADQFETTKGYRIFLTKCLGRRAGYRNSLGYLAVSVLGRSLLCHRIVWAMVNGRDPVGDVDHRDLCRSNNTPGNLREATRSQNCMNKRRRSDNHSGIKGVHWHKASGKWAASIGAKNVGIRHLGTFASKEAAAEAYRAAAIDLHGDFAQGIAA